MAATIELITVARQATVVFDILNIFHYRSDVVTDPDSSELLSLAQDFHDSILPAIRAFQSDQIVYTEIRVTEVGGLAFAVLPVTAEDGDLSGDAMPPYNVIEFIYNRASRLTRNGFKRFSGLLEGSVDQAGNITGAQATAVSAAEVFLELPITGVSTEGYRPIILGRPIPPATTFRIGEVVSVGFRRASTQVSRKSWH